jgi:hypothetical protein
MPLDGFCLQTASSSRKWHRAQDERSPVTTDIVALPRLCRRSMELAGIVEVTRSHPVRAREETRR